MSRRHLRLQLDLLARDFLPARISPYVRKAIQAFI